MKRAQEKTPDSEEILHWGMVNNAFYFQDFKYITRDKAFFMCLFLYFIYL